VKAGILFPFPPPPPSGTIREMPASLAIVIAIARSAQGEFRREPGLVIEFPAAIADAALPASVK
jgi:hypothetical protein